MDHKSIVSIYIKTNYMNQFEYEVAPISTVGAKEEWKKAQKKAKKDMTSNTINKILP
jgi:hypothetical protein